MKTADYLASNLLSRRNIIAIIFLLSSITFYILGVAEPLMTTKYKVVGLTFKTQEVTLFDSIRMFLESKDYLISAIILIFTFILPVSKYIELVVRLITGKQFLYWQGIDKWNMIDVFLVAMLLLNFKMDSKIIVMKLEMGTNFIALAVLTRLAVIMLTDGIRKECK